MYKIIDAEERHIDLLERAIENFKTFATNYTDIVDDHSVHMLMLGLISNGIFLVAEKDDEVIGSIGGLVGPSPFDNDTLIANEMFWWVEEQHRTSSVGSDLLFLFEKSAKDLGCKMITMTVLNNTPEVVEKSLKSKGFSLGEKSYIKRI